MGSYSYVVIDKMGKERKGSMEAVDEEKVKTSLRAEGLIPLEISAQSLLTKDIDISFGSGVTPRDLSIFCRQFVSMVQAGVTIIATLDMLSDQTENKKLKKAIKEVQINIEKGETLAESMRNQDRVFPSILTSMVEAGEASGSLEVAFSRMAEHFEKDAKLKGMIKKAMIYPIVVGLVAVGVIIIMLTVVIPNFTTMFDQMGTEMPAITIAVVNMSNFIRKFWYLLIILIVLLVSGIGYFGTTKMGKWFFGTLAVKIPMVGNLTIKSYSSRMSRTLSTLMAAGISTVEAIEITARTMDNVLFKEVLENAREEVMRGVPLSEPIKASGLFPPMVCHMTKIGEETGSIEDMLHKVADYYDEEVELATQSLMAALEPMIIVILSLIVGVLIMAVMSPMLSMYQGLDNL